MWKRSRKSVSKEKRAHCTEETVQSPSGGKLQGRFEKRKIRHGGRKLEGEGERE